MDHIFSPEGSIWIPWVMDMPGVAYRAAMCRCGASKNKPHCDNSHEKIQFKDYGTVGKAGNKIVEGGVKLRVTLLENGPLLLKGSLVIASGNGRDAWRGDSVALYRCGSSKNKPFCDGSHTESGFKSE